MILKSQEVLVHTREDVHYFWQIREQLRIVSNGEKCLFVLTRPGLFDILRILHGHWFRQYQTSSTQFFENLHYVVIDELHTYRGVFGSHMAHVIARLRRIANFHGSDPVFICWEDLDP